MVVADGQEIPLACSTVNASPAEVKLVEGVLIQVPRPEDRSIPLISDYAYDSDPLRETLKQSKWDLICPIAKVENEPRCRTNARSRIIAADGPSNAT